MSRAKPEDRQYLPRLADIPIPEDVTVGPTWPEGLQELASWIGAYGTLRLCEAMGGEQIYVPHSLNAPVVAAVLPTDKREVLARIYGGSRFYVPTAAKEMRAARRAAVVASVRAKEMTCAVAAQIVGTSLSYMSHLVNQTSEGVGLKPVVLPDPKGLRLLKHAADNVVAQLDSAGVSPAIVAGAWTAVMAAWGRPNADLATLARAPAAPLFGNADGE